MASVGVNALRWSALGFGVLYGIYHQSTINSRDKVAAKKADWSRKEQLITQAKQEFARQNAPPGSGPQKDDITAMLES